MDKVSVYKAKDGYRWHRQSENGRIVSESGEGYANKADAIEIAESVNGGEYEVVDADDE